jgi:hypothetical protein
MDVLDQNVANALKQFAEVGRYVEAPYSIKEIKYPSIFLGGGISNCQDWQSFMALALMNATDLTVFNPRRINFDINDPTASNVQIRWEFKFLEHADVLIFWFPNTSVCPITLFEYGKWLGKKKIYVGCEPGYTRKFDIEVQSELELGKPIHIYTSISDLAAAVIKDYSINRS